MDISKVCKVHCKKSESLVYSLNSFVSNYLGGYSQKCSVASSLPNEDSVRKFLECSEIDLPCMFSVPSTIPDSDSIKLLKLATSAELFHNDLVLNFEPYAKTSGFPISCDSLLYGLKITFPIEYESQENYGIMLKVLDLKLSNHKNRSESWGRTGVVVSNLFSNIKLEDVRIVFMDLISLFKNDGLSDLHIEVPCKSIDNYNALLAFGVIPISKRRKGSLFSSAAETNRSFSYMPMESCLLEDASSVVSCLNLAASSNISISTAWYFDDPNSKGDVYNDVFTKITLFGLQSEKIEVMLNVTNFKKNSDIDVFVSQFSCWCKEMNEIKRPS